MLPLSRFTVLDLTRVRAGPTCVRQLADWGADVDQDRDARRATPATACGGDRARLRLPEPPSQQARDHAQPASDPRAWRSSSSWPRKADVVVENYRPDVKTASASTTRRCARSTRASSTAASPASARTGPYRDRPGFDQIAQGMGGLMSITGLPGQGPVRVGIPIADLCAGIFAALRHPGGAARARAIRARASGCRPRCSRR